MFGGKKRREREAQIQAAMHQQQEQPADGAAAQQGPRVTIRSAGGAHNARIEAAIEAALQQNPAFANNPDLASQAQELMRLVQEDPQAFKQRMREIAANSGASAFRLTPEGLVPLTGLGAPGETGHAGPGVAELFGEQASPSAPAPAPWDAGAFGGQQAGPPAPPAPQPHTPTVPSGGNPLNQLDELAKLHTSGALTDAEFEAEKRRILGG